MGRKVAKANFLSTVTVVDVLVAIAILMILSALILPHFAASYTKLSPHQRAHPPSADEPAP
jgi:hypothetical protein